MTEPVPLRPGSWAGLKVLVLAPMPTEPLDYGNRKRGYFVCADLKARGAEVHYVHYASEGDWRRNPPLQANRVMQECWDALYTVPVTKPLHMPPADGGRYHSIDEWWDPAIGDMLHWLFSTQSFDVLLVNYTWLSKALEFAPRATLKVLDTHDRFAGRRELLEENGLAPEFFYTTEDQEKIALDRADVVWAIKRHEEEYFRTLTSRRLVTVPYLETIRPLNRSVPPNGILRFGIVGARNNVNLTNIRSFLQVARHYVERTLLPMEIHIAGSCCEDLKHDPLPPFVKRIGRVPVMADFYREVDVVLAPMTFSTGLKIKVGEALNLGKALIAHAHAYEGYEPTHDFHHLPDFEACMWACKQVVANPERIVELERASVVASLASARTVADSLDSTIERYWQLEPGACVVLDVAELRTGSLVFDHACDVARYLGWQGPVHFVLGGAWDGTADVDAIYRLGQIGEPVLLPGLHASHAAKLGPALQRPNIRCRSFAELAAEGHAALWFAGAPPAGEAVPRRLAMPAFISFEAFTQARPAADFAAVVQNLAQAMELLHVLSRDDHPAVSAARRNAKVEHLRVPMLFKGHQAYAIWALERARRDGVLVLADEADDPLLALVREQAGLYGVGEMDLLVAATAKLAPRLPGIRLRDHGSYFRDVWNHATAPAVVVDISSGANHAALIETFARSGLPTIRLFTGMARARATQVQEQTEAGGTFASVQLLRRALQDTGTLQQAARRRVASFEQANDPGWAIIWSVMGEYRQARHVT